MQRGTKRLCRVLCVVAALLCPAAPGCQHILQKDGSYSEFENFAMRLDYEFNQFHLDIKEIFFGLEPRAAEQWRAIWQIYDE